MAHPDSSNIDRIPKTTSNTILPTNAYRIAWICPTPTDYDAAEYMLDKKHETPTLPEHSTDQNVYTVGDCFGHNVVIVTFPRGDTNGAISAAHVVEDLQSTFQRVESCILIGVAGALSVVDSENCELESDEHLVGADHNQLRKADIRLGDVVVSVPDRKKSGVVRYFQGLDGAIEVQTSGFNNLSETLRMATNHLKGGYFFIRRNNSEERCILLNISRLLSDLSANRASDYGYDDHDHEPTISKDKLKEYDLLFPQTYSHSEECVRNKCCTKSGLTRAARFLNNSEPSELPATSRDTMRLKLQALENCPQIHYGTIASGDIQIADPKLREDVRKATNALCADQEAAALLQLRSKNMKFLIVRGISNYSDSHSHSEWNERYWKEYAAMTAAACARELLAKIPRKQT